MVVETFGILEGGVYVYTATLPAGCHGAHYKVHRLILDVPSLQRKLLVEALDGPDAGLWFSCSPANFSRRYALDRTDADPEPARRAFVDDKPAGPGAGERGKGL